MSQSATNSLNWGRCGTANPTEQRRITENVGKSRDAEVLEKDPFLKLLLNGPTDTNIGEKRQHLDLAPVMSPKDLGAKGSMTISPEKSFYFYWTMFLTLAFYYNVIFVILRAAYSDLQEESLLPIWFTLDYLADAVYVVDAVFSSRLEFRRKRTMVSDVKRLRKRYLHSWVFFLDVLAVAPIELLQVGLNPLFRMNRFLKFWRVVKFVTFPAVQAKLPVAMRIVVILSFLLMIQWNPSVHFTISQYIGMSSYADFIVHSLAIVIIFVTIFPNKTAILEKCAYKILRKNVSMETEINEHLATLRKASIFRDCNPGLFLKLVLKLRYNGLSPLEYICKKGDIGKEMYILKHGTLEVVSDDGLTVFATLTKGAVFCELSSILNIAGIKCGSLRTVNVRSVGYSHVFCLQKSDLWDALTDYPDTKRILLERGDITL